MKNIYLILILFAGMFGVSAQTPVATKIKTLPALNDGNGLTIPINVSYSDTVKSGDTLFYKVLVGHNYVIYPYISILTKSLTSTKDTTTLLSLWQSVDGVHNWQRLYRDSVSVMVPYYGLTLAKSTTTGTELDFWRYKLLFQSTYLGIRLIGKTKSGFTGIYYGSVRVNRY